MTKGRWAKICEHKTKETAEAVSLLPTPVTLEATDTRAL